MLLLVNANINYTFNQEGKIVVQKGYRELFHDSSCRILQEMIERFEKIEVSVTKLNSEFHIIKYVGLHFTNINFKVNNEVEFSDSVHIYAPVIMLSDSLRDMIRSCLHKDQILLELNCSEYFNEEDTSSLNGPWENYAKGFLNYYFERQLENPEIMDFLQKKQIIESKISILEDKFKICSKELNTFDSMSRYYTIEDVEKITENINSILANLKIEKLNDKVLTEKFLEKYPNVWR